MIGVNRLTPYCICQDQYTVKLMHLYFLLFLQLILSLSVNLRDDGYRGVWWL